MKQKCIKLAFIFAILTAVFDVVYIGFAIPWYIHSSYDYISIIIRIIGVIPTVLFIIGLKKENPVLMTIKFVYGIISNVFGLVNQIIGSSYHGVSYLNLVSLIAGSLSGIVWNLVLLFVVIIIFKATEDKSKTTVPLAVVQPENKDRTGMLQEYKNLLDMGAITQEEFEEKKKELLNI